MEFFQDAFVDIAESVTLFIIRQIELVYDVDDLTEQNAILHIVVGVGESRLDDGLSYRRRCCHGKGFERREQSVVHEIEKHLSGHCRTGTVVRRPIRPSARVGNDGSVARFVEFPVALLHVVHFEKEHPRNLLDALGIAIDAGVIAHDISDSFDKS